LFYFQYIDLNCFLANKELIIKTMAMSKQGIIGSFVFRDEGDGCLTSKYMHDDSLQCPFTEGCKFISASTTMGKFCGIYQSVWIEDNDNYIKAGLSIEKHPKNDSIYKLRWYEPGDPNAIIFYGTGMLFENLLVGAYWA
jgi:hypothetical protein